MFISLKSVTESPEFKGVKILAGKEGLYRNVTGISTIDLRKEFITLDCIDMGDLYMTSLHQYANECDQNVLWDFIKILINKNCSGLIIISCDNIGRITPSIIKKCDDARFPILYFGEAKKYSDLMKAVNKYIAIEIYNASRTYRLQKVLSETLTEKEILSILDSFESEIQSYILVITYAGDINSDSLKREFSLKTLKSGCDAFIDCNYVKYYILSAKSPEALNNHKNVIKRMIKECFDIYAMGESNIYLKNDFKKALLEATNAYKISKNTGKTEFSFPRISSYNIIATTYDTSEAREYYKAFVQIIGEYASDEHKSEIMETVKAFVNNKGDYKATAKAVNQHENTIRYRISKLKSWLEMDDDNISFFETISLITKYIQFME